MYLCFGLIVLFSWWSLKKWNQVPVLGAASSSEVTEDTLRYVSTPGRYLGVFTFYGIFVGSIFLLALSVLSGLLPAKVIYVDGSVNPLLPVALLGLMLAAPYLPLASRPVQGLSGLFQRHLFVPVLPSRAEQVIIRNLASQQVTFQPNARRVREVLGEAHGLDTDGGIGATDILSYKLSKLAFVCSTLEAELNSGMVRFKHWYFKQEWELIMTGLNVVSQRYRQLPAQMASGSFDDTPVSVITEMDDRIETSLFYCYQLLTRYVFLTRFSQAARYNTFKCCGFLVDLKANRLYSAGQWFLEALTDHLPNGRIKGWLGHFMESERREAGRIHVCLPVTLAINGEQLNAGSLVLSRTGAAIKGNTQQPVGSPVILAIEGLEPVSGTLARKAADDLCIMFAPDTEVSSPLAASPG